MQSPNPYNTRFRTKSTGKILDNAGPQGASVSVKASGCKTQTKLRHTSVNQDSYPRSRSCISPRQLLPSKSDQTTMQSLLYSRHLSLITKKPVGVIKPYTGRDVTIGQEPLRRREMLAKLDNTGYPRANLPGRDARSYTKIKSRNTFVFQDSKSCQKQRSGQSDVFNGIDTQSEHSVDDLFAKQLAPSEITPHDSNEFCINKKYTRRDTLADNLHSLKEQDDTEYQNSLDNHSLGHRMMSEKLDNINHLSASVHYKDASITEIQTSERGSPEKNHRKSLGIDLAQECSKYSCDVPPIIVKCLQEVEKRGMCCEGIYRNSAGRTLVHYLCQYIEGNQLPINFETEDPHVICNVLKEYLKYLREPLLTFGLYRDLIEFGMKPGSTLKVRVEEDLKKITDKLPLINRRTCGLIMRHLQKVTEYAKKNKMTARQLGEVFHQLLLRFSSESILLPGQESKSATCAAIVVELLITYADIIFRPEKENAIPEELSYNPHDVDLFLKAVEEGTEKDKCVRVMVVGHYAQGKTSLTRRLSGQSFEGIQSTDGIEVHRKQCYKNRQKWESRSTTEQEDEMINRLIKVSISHQISLKNEEADIDTEINCHATTESKSQKSQLYAEGRAYFKNTKQQEEKKVEIGHTAVKPFITAPEEKMSGISKEGRYDKILCSRFAKKLRQSKQLPSTDIREESVIDINVWDFGGQFVYYATHQIFHSKNAIYLLVFNLQEDLDNHLVDEDFSNIKFTMKSALEFWMDSILSFVGSDEEKKPTVILVGTHKNDCQGKERQRIESVLDIFSKTKAMSHILPTQFAVECVDPNDTEVEKLRKVVYELSEKSTKHNIIPAKWIPLEKKMFELKEKKIVLYTEILKINAESSHPIPDEDQLKLFLKYHHEKGNIVFFDEDDLCEFVVLDAQFLIDAFKSIITSKCFYKWSPNLQPLGDKLLESATLEMSLLNEIWKNTETHEFNKHKDILLKFMKRLRILAEIKNIQATSEKSPNEASFLVPSLLKGNAEEDMVSDFLHPCKMRSKVSLILAFGNSSILQLLYQRVMAAVLAKWQPLVIPNQGPLLFRNLGIYELNLQHAGLVILGRSGLEVTTVNLCPYNQIDAKVCDKFRRYIEMVIMSEFEKFSNSLKNEIFKYYIRCNHPDHGYKGSVYVHELKRVEAEHEVYCPDHYCHSVNVQESLVEWFQSDDILLNENLPENEISDKELSKVAQTIGENWTLLGIELGLGQEDIDCLKEDHLRSGVRTTIYFMLKEWKKRNPHQDNLKTLITIMKQCNNLRVNWDKINNIIDKF